MKNHTQTTPARTKWKPGELAARWGIPESRVLHWILSGQLRAVDASDRLGDNPDYRVDILDLMIFEQEREIRPSSNDQQAEDAAR